MVSEIIDSLNGFALKTEKLAEFPANTKPKWIRFTTNSVWFYTLFGFEKMICEINKNKTDMDMIFFTEFALLT